METEGSLSDRAIKTFSAEVDRLVPGSIMVAAVYDSNDKVVAVYDGDDKKDYQSAFIAIRTPEHFTIAKFKLVSMPGCCGVLISTDSWVHESWRGRGIGKLMQTMKEWFARELKIGCLLATVVKGNQPEENLLRKTGWRPVSEFVNPKTGNTINVWKKEF